MPPDSEERVPLAEEQRAWAQRLGPELQEEDRQMLLLERRAWELRRQELVRASAGR